MKFIFKIILLLVFINGFGQTNYPKQYSVPETGGTVQWIKLGTYTAAQAGQMIKITIIGHIGYNAANEQDFEAEIYFKTSNGGSVDGSGFAGNSNYNTKGSASGGFYSAKWVANAAGVAATTYDLYVKIGAFTLGSTYTVENSSGTWNNIGQLLGDNDPGNSSSTICISVNQLVLGSPVYLNNSQYIRQSQFDVVYK